VVTNSPTPEPTETPTFAPVQSDVDDETGMPPPLVLLLFGASVACAVAAYVMYRRERYF
jgi:hypothetical protein